jgi:hypothetical protein
MGWGAHASIIAPCHARPHLMEIHVLRGGVAAKPDRSVALGWISSPNAWNDLATSGQKLSLRTGSAPRETTQSSPHRMRRPGQPAGREIGKEVMLVNAGKADVAARGASGSDKATQPASRPRSVLAGLDMNSTDRAELPLHCPACSRAMERRSDRHFACAPCRQSIHTFEVAGHRYLDRGRWPWVRARSTIGRA